MLRALFLSIGQLTDPPVLRVLLRSLLLTLAIFAALGIATWWGMQALLAHWLGGGWGATGLATAVSIFVSLLAFWLLFRAVGIAVVGLFADTVVEAVERRHYPAALAGARGVPFAQGVAMGLRSATRAVLVNLLALPVYVALLVTGIGTAAAFFLVNGWLLGRDLGDMVAVRHLSGAPLSAWRRASATRRLLLGLANTALFVVPGLNLLAPVLGAAMATHLFHRNRP